MIHNFSFIWEGAGRVSAQHYAAHYLVLQLIIGGLSVRWHHNLEELVQDLLAIA